MSQIGMSQIDMSKIGISQIGMEASRVDWDLGLTGILG